MPDTNHDPSSPKPVLSFGPEGWKLAVKTSAGTLAGLFSHDGTGWRVAYVLETEGRDRVLVMTVERRDAMDLKRRETTTPERYEEWKASRPVAVWEDVQDGAFLKDVIDLAFRAIQISVHLA